MSEKNISIAEALETLTTALQNDPEYAHTWHCNLSVCVQEAMGDTTSRSKSVVGNLAASRIMGHVFRTQTSATMLDPKNDPDIRK
jgi:hypothetical protein